MKTLLEDHNHPFYLLVILLSILTHPIIVLIFFIFLAKRRRTDTIDQSIPRREVNLKSVKNLQRAIDEQERSEMKTLLEDHKFVGTIDWTSALIQHSKNLYLANTRNLTKKLFRQIIIFNFGNFGYMRLKNPAPLYDLAMRALETEKSGWTQSDGPKEQLAQYAVELLKNKADMLSDYFSIEITQDGELTKLPLLLKNYDPDENTLPMFVLRMATDVSTLFTSGLFTEDGGESNKAQIIQFQNHFSLL